MPEDRQRRTTRRQERQKDTGSGWQLVAVQSASCIVIVLIALLFRLIGGTAFTQLRSSFNQAVMSNSILATLAALLESPSDSSSKDADGSTAEQDIQSQPESSGKEESETSEVSGTSESTSAATSEAETTAAETTTRELAASTTVSTAPAMGGSDISVSQRKVLYAPEGATFLPLKINRPAYKPLESGRVTSWFGYRENPLGGGESFHQGLDIAAEQGSPIAVMYFGVVRETGQSAGYGNYVRIYHGNGIEVLYAHCSEILAGQDAVIRAGEIVARVGSTGESTGPHVHIEVLLHGVAYDPAGIVPVDAYA